MFIVQLHSEWWSNLWLDQFNLQKREILKHVIFRITTIWYSIYYRYSRGNQNNWGYIVPGLPRYIVPALPRAVRVHCTRSALVHCTRTAPPGRPIRGQEIYDNQSWSAMGGSAGTMYPVYPGQCGYNVPGQTGYNVPSLPGAVRVQCTGADRVQCTLNRFDCPDWIQVSK